MQDPESSSGCRVVTLARGPFVRVDCCRECGTLTLCLGPFSFRVDRSAAESLWTTLGQALSRYSSREGDLLVSTAAGRMEH